MTKKIKSWEELEKCESDKYYIEVDKKFYNGRVLSKDKNRHHVVLYLSTHTFYGGQITTGRTKALQKLGFDIELIPY